MARRGWRKRRHRGWLFFYLTLVLLVLSGIFLFWVVDQRLRPTLLRVAEAKARQIAVGAINSVINEKLVGEIKYEDLITVRTDSKGKIAMIQYNTGEITRVASRATTLVQAALKGINQMQISLPLGQVLGSPILASLGPWLHIRVLPLGVVQAEVEDDFEQAGINQIRHRIHLVITTDMRLIVPLISTNIGVKAQVPITEATIMGEVPQTYLQADGLAKILGR